MPTIEFYFDYRSPYSYLAHCQLQRMPVVISYHPFDIRHLMEQVGNVPTTVTCKAKGQYAKADIQRWTARYEVPFQRHSNMRAIDFLQLLRLTAFAINQGKGPAVITALYDAVWASDTPLSTPDEIVAALAGTGLRSEEIEVGMNDPAWNEVLGASTQTAVDKGVFGAPTMFLGDEMYFGNDRLHFIDEKLKELA